MSYPKSSEELADQEEEQKSQFKGSIGDSRLSWLGIIFAMLLSGLVGWGWNRWFTSQINSATPSPGANQAPQPPSIPVKLSTIATQRVEKSSEFVGTLEASRTVNLKPEISGRVVEILVKEGDEISILVVKKSNVLRESFGSHKFSKSTEQLMKETDRELYNEGRNLFF
jgi:biotin carboxyl carrier protein